MVLKLRTQAIILLSMAASKIAVTQLRSSEDTLTDDDRHKLKKNTLNRGRTDRISLTHDLDLEL